MIGLHGGSGAVRYCIKGRIALVGGILGLYLYIGVVIVRHRGIALLSVKRLKLLIGGSLGPLAYLKGGYGKALAHGRKRDYMLSGGQIERERFGIVSQIIAELARLPRFLLYLEGAEIVIRLFVALYRRLVNPTAGELHLTGIIERHFAVNVYRTRNGRALGGILRNRAAALDFEALEGVVMQTEAVKPRLRHRNLPADNPVIGGYHRFNALKAAHGQLILAYGKIAVQHKMLRGRRGYTCIRLSRRGILLQIGSVFQPVL